ncbi:hypothetical protein, partial [Escherichia coli]
SHWSTSKTPSYTKSVSWQHHQESIAQPADVDYDTRWYLPGWFEYPPGKCVTSLISTLTVRLSVMPALRAGFFLYAEKNHRKKRQQIKKSTE